MPKFNFKYERGSQPHVWLHIEADAEKGYDTEQEARIAIARLIDRDIESAKAALHKLETLRNSVCVGELPPI